MNNQFYIDLALTDLLKKRDAVRKSLGRKTGRKNSNGKDPDSLLDCRRAIAPDGGRTENYCNADHTEHRLLISKGKHRLDFIESYYDNGKRMRISLNKDPDLAYRLANIAYCKELLKRITQRIELLEQIKRSENSLDYEKILKELPHNYDLLNPQLVMHPFRKNSTKRIMNPLRDESLRPMILRPTMERMFAATFWDHPDEIKDRLAMVGIKDHYKGYMYGKVYIPSPEEWMVMPYRANTEHTERLTQDTGLGIKVRSKSEILLVTTAVNKSVPSHYDEVFETGKGLVSPDLTGLYGRNFIKAWEHNGMNTAVYNDRHRIKRERYAAAEFSEGINLFYTFDSADGSISMRVLDALMDEAFGTGQS